MGRSGEDLAASFLSRLGYRIVTRNFRSSVGELDLVAEKEGEVVFVEVRARASAGAGAALESVGRLKRRRIILAARVFLAANRLGGRPVRFDVIAVGGSGQEIRHEINAFQEDS